MMSEQEFDSNRQIDLKLQSANGAKALTIRFPSDAEWIERQQKRKIIVKQLGRGISDTITPDSADIDLELLKQIRIGEEELDIDEYEASRIIDQLSQADVDDVLPGAASYTVILKVPGATVSHSMLMPSAKDIFQYRRSFIRSLNLPYNKQQLTINLEAAASLYEKAGAKAFGYSAEVPIIHKAAVVQAVVEHIESGFGVAGSENF